MRNVVMEKLLARPIGVGAHVTGDHEMGMEAAGYGGGVGDGGPLRHMLGVESVNTNCGIGVERDAQRKGNL